MNDSDNQYGVIVGDSDTLVLLGGEAQCRLRECSQLLSDISLHDNGNLDVLLNKIILNMEQFSFPPRRRLWLFLRKSHIYSKSTLVKKYRTILDFITKATVELQMQEAQLIKDNEILKYLLLSIDQVIFDLEHAIAFATNLQCANETESSVDLSKCMEYPLDNLWRDRLERRIQDMSVSYAISLQMKTQMMLIRENNTKLIDKILGAISNTIPLWQNRISLLLGIEKASKDSTVQDQIDTISSNFHSDMNCAEVTSKEDIASDFSPSIASVSKPIQETFRELYETEKNDEKLRREIITALYAH